MRVWLQSLNGVARTCVIGIAHRRANGAGITRPRGYPAGPHGGWRVLRTPTTLLTATLVLLSLAGAADASTHVMGKRVACAVPSAPGSVSATAGANQAKVSWSAANGNGTAIDAYV